MHEETLVEALFELLYAGLAYYIEEEAVDDAEAPCPQDIARYKRIVAVLEKYEDED